MRLKYKPDPSGGIVIRFKEEPAAYYDECNIDKLGNFVQRLSAYYSEKGELVELRISTGDLKERYIRECTERGRNEEECEREFEEQEKEVMIPDVLPARRYVFLYGKADGEPKGCVDSFTEIRDTDDRFRWSGYRLTMWRLDGNEMNKDEIWELRNDFLDDVFEWLDPYEWFVESVYWDKKLYFWIWDVEESMALRDLLEVVIQTVFPYFEELSIEDTEMGMRVDIIITEPIEREFDFCADFNDVFHTNFTGREVALICIPYFEPAKENEPPIIEREELIEICRETEYENRMIILDRGVQLSDEAIEYARSSNIEIRGIVELIRQRNIEIAKRNDADPEKFVNFLIDLKGQFL